MDSALGEFLREIEGATDVDWGSLVKILIVHCTSLDDFTRLRALTWVNVFILVGKEKLLPYSALLLSGILPCLSHEIADIGMRARKSIGPDINFLFRRGSFASKHEFVSCIKYKLLLISFFIFEYKK